MHVAQLSFYMDPQRRLPKQLLQEWSSLVDVAEAAALGGARVSVIQACHVTETITQNDVTYYFLPFGHSAPGTPLNEDFSALMRHLTPDVFHVHGLGFPHDTIALSAYVRPAPVVIQDHANRPPRLWRRNAWRKSLSMASGVAFCARDQAQPFTRAKLLPSHTPVYEVPESTSRFLPGDQKIARRATGLSGSPLILWVGHLDVNKDPLTVLDGVSAAARLLPELRLVCAFGTAPLLAEVQKRIAADELLRDRVELLGRVAHEAVEPLMHAADLFVLGSHREGSGYSLIEALACGLPPVVTDIPSFRLLTGEGSVGALWPRGDAQSLAESIVSMASRPKVPLRNAVRAHFENELSSRAVGRKLCAMYEEVLQRGVARIEERTRSDSDETVPAS